MRQRASSAVATDDPIWLPDIDSIYLPARVFAAVVHCQVGLKQNLFKKTSNIIMRYETTAIQGVSKKL